MEKKTNLSVFLNGIIKENPVLVLLLGTCPTLAISSTVQSALGMGAATILVLICSNVAISLLKNIIPQRVRIPSYIVLIAGFVTIVQQLIRAYLPAIDQALGIYLPLIVVNCIVLGRAEMFASKNSVLKSAIDGLGMGVGFTLALFLMSSIREFLGSGTWFGIELTNKLFNPIMFFVTPAGGFFVFGIIVALVNKIMSIYNRKPKSSIGCGNDCQGCSEKEEA